MFSIDEMTVVSYDPEADAMSITPSESILANSKYERSIDIDNRSQVIIDIGDNDNIRTIEILSPARLFKTTNKALRESEFPDIKYDCYVGETGKANVLDIFIENLGGLRAVWGDGTTEHLMFLKRDRMPIVTEKR
jgi:uncharacterized protein YuzE